MVYMSAVNATEQLLIVVLYFLSNTLLDFGIFVNTIICLKYDWKDYLLW